MDGCIDLQERFGAHYRVQWEAAGATKARWPKAEWRWLREISCRYGRVSPWGGELLQAMTDHPRIGQKLRALAFVSDARGDCETVIRFSIDHVDEVLRILRPCRRRHLTAHQRERLNQIGTPTRFRPTHGVQTGKTGSNAPKRRGA